MSFGWNFIDRYHRHGPRLDAADQSWHLSTPTPYDPPLTYGGWNQTRALGARIASLLHAREENLSTTNHEDGVRSYDFAQADDRNHREGGDGQERPAKRRRVQHKVVIHTSPFLRCLQTSVGIAAGMAQYSTGTESGHKQTTAGMRMHSPRTRPTEGHISPNLAPVPDPKHDLAHEIARKVLHDHKRYRKSEMRVDAFLGEWLNPEYFENITPPPPSAMMVKTAKVELMQNETVEIFTPAGNAGSSNNSLWGGGSSGTLTPSKESTIDDWSPVEEALPAPASPTRRDRASTHATESGRKSPYRPGSPLQPLTSSIPKQETSIYHPPTPHYAVSSSDRIPRGYVDHARNACTDIDQQWDSMRPPLSWGDGGVLGEEWSSMHKRMRRGLNHMIHWYRQSSDHSGGEAALGLDQAESHDDIEEEEDLVVILVTHGAGCNALIGALTGQPVLLDVGMASLTMAVRRDDAPSITTYASSEPPSEVATPRRSPNPEKMNGNARRGSVDAGLSAVYEMKILASSEHLRPGADPTKTGSTFSRANSSHGRDSLSMFRLRSGIGADAGGRPRETGRSNTSSALGTIRRPSHVNVGTAEIRSSSVPRSSRLEPPGGPTSNPGLWTPPVQPASPGLWTPPTGNTPILAARMQAETKDEEFTSLSSLPETAQAGKTDGGGDISPDPSISISDSQPTSSHDNQPESEKRPAAIGSADSQVDNTSASRESTTTDRPKLDMEPPNSLSGDLNQSGLWGAKPSGDRVVRSPRDEPKRRWTVEHK